MKYGFVHILVGAFATTALHYLAPISWALAALLAFVGWPVLGTLITIDDDLPGGVDNPDGNVRPEWLQAPFWARVVLGLGIAAVVAVFDRGPSSPAGMFFGGSALVAFGLSATLASRES